MISPEVTDAIFNVKEVLWSYVASSCHWTTL